MIFYIFAFSGFIKCKNNNSNTCNDQNICVYIRLDLIQYVAQILAIYKLPKHLIKIRRTGFNVQENMDCNRPCLQLLFTIFTH